MGAGHFMDDTQTVYVRRPRRWDEPLDAAMTNDDVAWLRTRHPFASMRDAAFPKATPLRDILRFDCRIRRCGHGEIVVREGDYGNSAFLVLAGNVRVALESFRPELLGQHKPQRKSWGRALGQLWRRSRWAEVRSADSVHAGGATRVRSIDDRQAVFLQDFAGVFTQCRSLAVGPGELFGEVAAMYRTPQSATVVAEEEATLLEIRWQGLRLLRRDAVFAEQLEQHYRKHWLIPHLRETPLLRFMPEDGLQRVAQATHLRSFGRMEWNLDFKKARRLPVADQIQQEPLIASEGSLPTDWILIRAGFARLSQQHGDGHQTTAYLGKGHSFGLPELAHNILRPSGIPPQPLRFSLRGVGFVDTMHIPLEVVASEILPHVRRSELQRLADSLASAKGSDTTLGILGTSSDQVAPVASVGSAESTSEEVCGSKQAGAERRMVPREKPGESDDVIVHQPPQHMGTSLLEFLVAERLTNGQQAMVIDLNRCTRCDDCVKACATVHDGNPRMTRTGPTHDGLMFAQACMHCTDPVCMIGCPTGAISRDPASGTAQISEAICIGCGTCAAACPYDNIQMVEIRDAQGRTYLDEATSLPIKKATKCDLCQTQPGGPACQNACPHDALVRIDLSHTGPLDRFLGRQRG